MTYLLRKEELGFAFVLHLDHRYAASWYHDERPVLEFAGHERVIESAADQTFDVEHGVFWIHRDLVLRCITRQTFGIGECDERRGGSVALIVGDDLDLAISEYAHTRVARTQIDSDCRHLVAYDCWRLADW